jgi:hypothetical protein
MGRDEMRGATLKLAHHTRRHASPLCAEAAPARRARTAALRALLRRLDGPALDRLLRNNAGWVPAGSDDRGLSADGRTQHLLTPERVVCAGGGWGTVGLGAGQSWRAVEPPLTESGRIRRRQVCECTA